MSVVFLRFVRVDPPEVNPITAGAFVLGLFSGELRHRSASLLPAILVHAVFNAFAAIL